MWIEYKYEYPVYLDDGTIFYHDFTFICPITRREIYWVNMGMIGDAGYTENEINK